MLHLRFQTFVLLPLSPAKNLKQKMPSVAKQSLGRESASHRHAVIPPAMTIMSCGLLFRLTLAAIAAALLWLTVGWAMA